MHRVSELHKITGRIGRRDECTAEIRDAVHRAERHMTKLLLDGMRSIALAA
jgi:predicted fused transcriptional regulator/phosphomethylpyrimidine kinase